MTSECYYGDCEYHESNDPTPDNGPFCHEPKCLATPEFLRQQELKRQKYLNERNWIDIPNQK